MKTLPLKLSVMVLTALPYIAQAEHQHSPAELEKVIVSGVQDALPETLATLKKAEIDAKKAQTSDTAALLKGIPGVSLYGAGGVSSLPVIHGFADDRLRIKVDGMDLISACANHMNPPLSYISPSHVEELKVYQGISPVSLGGDSIGGTVVAKSAKPQFASSADKVLTAGEVGAFYRSNGDARGADLSTTVATDKVSINYTGSTTKANNYDAGDNFKDYYATGRPDHTLDLDEVGSTAYETRNHAINLGFKLNENELVQLKMAYQDIPYQGWPNQRMDMTDNRGTQLNLIYSGLFDWGSLETNIYRESVHHKMQFGEDKQYWYGTLANIPGMPMETESETTGFSLNTEFNLSARDLLRIGTDIQLYRLDDFWAPSGGPIMSPNTFWNIRNGERNRYAVFSEWEANWNPQWMTLAGIRYERVAMNTDDVQGYNALFNTDANTFNAQDHSKNDDNIDLTLMAHFTPSASQSYEFGYAQKTRSPNLYERFAWSTNEMAMRMVNLVGDGNGYVGNLNLEPEVAHTLSLTANWHDAGQQNWHLSITPYISYISDYIDAERISNFTTTDSFVYLRYQNVSARIYGIDISATKKLFTSEKLGRITANAVINYLNGENRDSNDDLYNIMPLNATFSLDQQKGQWQNSVEWELVSAKDDLNDERNEQETAGYGLLHLRTSYQLAKTRFDFGIENVFDKLYQHPLGGAYSGQGATMQATGVPWGTTVPGMGRSFYAGISYKF